MSDDKKLMLSFTIEMPNGFSYDISEEVEHDWDEATVVSYANASLGAFTFHSFGEIAVESATLNGIAYTQEELDLLVLDADSKRQRYLPDITPLICEHCGEGFHDTDHHWLRAISDRDLAERVDIWQNVQVIYEVLARYVHSNI